MFYKFYIIVGIVILCAFSTAQYRGWTFFAADEERYQPGSGGHGFRNSGGHGLFHK